MFPVKWNKLQLAVDINRRGWGSVESESEHTGWSWSNETSEIPPLRRLFLREKILARCEVGKGKAIFRIIPTATSCVGASTRRYPREQLSERARKFLRREEKPGKVFAGKRGNWLLGRESSFRTMLARWVVEISGRKETQTKFQLEFCLPSDWITSHVNYHQRKWQSIRRNLISNTPKINSCQLSFGW